MTGDDPSPPGDEASSRVAERDSSPSTPDAGGQDEREAIRPTTAVSHRPITDELPTVDPFDEYSLADFSSPREQTDPMIRFDDLFESPAGLGGEPSWAREIEDYLGQLLSEAAEESQGASQAAPKPDPEQLPEDLMGVREQVMRWLGQLESYPGAGLVEMPAWGTTTPFRLLLDRGRICFGIELHDQPFVDMEFKRAAPELFEQLLDLFSSRRDQLDHPLQRCLVPQSEVTSDPSARRAMAQQLLRVIFRAARMSKGEHPELTIQPSPIKLASPPVQFTPLELFLTSRPPLDELADLAALSFEVLEARAQESWLLRRADRTDHPFDALMGVSSHELQTLERSRHIAAQARQMSEQLEALVSLERGWALAIEGDELWCCIVDPQMVCLQRHWPQQMGRLLSTLQTLRQETTPS